MLFLFPMQSSLSLVSHLPSESQTMNAVLILAALNTQGDVLLRALRFIDTLLQRDVDQKVMHCIILVLFV